MILNQWRKCCLSQGRRESTSLLVKNDVGVKTGLLMAPLNVPWHLNLRQKVMLGLATGIIAIGFIGIVSYHYLQVIELKQHFVEVADDLSNKTLEIRRS